MGLRTSTKLAVTALVVALLGAVTSTTFASFTAEARNPSSVATGTLVLSDTKGSGTACLSTAGGSTDSNVNTSCEALLSLTAMKPGDSATADVTLRNVGSLSASAFNLSATSCTDANAAGETYHGTGSVCGALLFTVQQYSDAARTTPSSCAYGGASGATCSFADATKTLAAFRTAHPTSSSGLAIGSGLAAGTSAYFRVAVQLPSSAGNDVQGRAASFALTWHLDQ